MKKVFFTLNDGRKTLLPKTDSERIRARCRGARGIFANYRRSFLDGLRADRTGSTLLGRDLANNRIGQPS